MQINLTREIEDHFIRVRTLAEDALEDTEESYSSRAAAQTALSAVIRDLTKSQAEVLTMERLLLTEQALVEAVKEVFTEDQYQVFLKKFTELIDAGKSNS